MKDDALFFILGFVAALFVRDMVRKSNKMEDEPKDRAGILFDCPYCKLPAEVTHLMAIQQGAKLKYMYVAECLGDDDPFMISEDQLAEME